MGSLAGGRVGDHEGEAVRLRELSHGTDHAKGAQIHEVMAGEHAARHQLRIVRLLLGLGFGVRIVRLLLGLGFGVRMVRLLLGLGFGWYASC